MKSNFSIIKYLIHIFRYIYKLNTFYESDYFTYNFKQINDYIYIIYTFNVLFEIIIFLYYLLLTKLGTDFYDVLCLYNELFTIIYIIIFKSG